MSFYLLCSFVCCTDLLILLYMHVSYAFVWTQNSNSNAYWYRHTYSVPLKSIHLLITDSITWAFLFYYWWHMCCRGRSLVDTLLKCIEGGVVYCIYTDIRMMNWTRTGKGQWCLYSRVKRHRVSLIRPRVKKHWMQVTPNPKSMWDPLASNANDTCLTY